MPDVTKPSLLQNKQCVTTEVNQIMRICGFQNKAKSTTLLQIIVFILTQKSTIFSIN